MNLSRRSRKRRLHKNCVVLAPNDHVTLTYSNDTHTHDTYESPSSTANNETDSDSSISEIPLTNLPETEKLIQFLRGWVAEFQIQKNAVNELLKHLKTNGFPNVPCDFRTILQTPKSRDIIEVSPGHYSHVGLKKALDYYVLNSEMEIKKLIVNINIDGVPISKSSSKSFRFILVHVIGGNCVRDVFVI